MKKKSTFLSLIFLLHMLLLLLWGCQGELHILESIKVTPDNVTSKPESFVDYKAEGKYKDDKTEDLTDSVTWLSEKDSSNDSTSDTAYFSKHKNGRFFVGKRLGTHYIYAKFKNSNITTLDAKPKETTGEAKLTVQ